MYPTRTPAHRTCISESLCVVAHSESPNRTDPAVIKTNHFPNGNPNDERAISPHVYKTRPGTWFAGKRAMALRDLIGSNGELIRAGEPITIKRKWAGFIVISDRGACAWRVPPESLSLL